MNSIIDGIDNRFHNFQYFSDTDYVWLAHLLLLCTLYRFACNMFLFLPKVLINEVLQILVDLLHHDHSFEPGSGFLGHEVADQFKFVRDSLKVAALQFEVDDPA